MRASRRGWFRGLRRGVVTPWLALCLTAIVAVVAFGLDGGRMLEERRHVQAAADAAALAGAAQLYAEYSEGQGKDPGGAAQDAAVKNATANGYTSDGSAAVVTVNIPPTLGSFTGQDGYVEVIVQSNLKASFAALFTGSALTVQARAVARGRPARIGVVSLSPSGPDAVVSKGKATFTVVNASIVVNSDDPKALHQASSGPLIAESFEVTGGYVNSSGGLMIGTIDTGVTPTADPLRAIPAPDPAAFTVQRVKNLHIDSALPTILSPGIYQGGISVAGNSVVNLKPGIYIMDGGGLDASGAALLSGVEVMIYNTGITSSADSIKLSGKGNISLTPPTSGIYQGISIFQDRSVNKNLSVVGNGASSVTGIIYAPAANVTVTGNGNPGVDLLAGGIIANKVTLTGNGSVDIRLGPDNPRVPEVNLVE